MEKNDQRETRDFMNVQSFSQLPFIRPTPLKEKGIRLFGKEVGGGAAGAEEDSESNLSNAAAAAASGGCGGESKDNENGESSRKFECHYCCRNFPTSQALGGHQNAHKRERQHAKRANLQSAMGLSAADAQLYGLINYRIGSAAPATAPAVPYHHHSSQPWSSGTRVYGSPYSSQPPINGSPLALWRVPTTVPHNSPPSSYFTRDRSIHPLPLLAKEADLKPPSSVATHQSRFGYDPKPPSVKDNHVVSISSKL